MRPIRIGAWSNVISGGVLKGWAALVSVPTYCTPDFTSLSSTRHKISVWLVDQSLARSLAGLGTWSWDLYASRGVAYIMCTSGCGGVVALVIV